MDPDLLRVKQLAALLGVSERTVWRRLKDGTLPRPVRIGRVVRFRRSTIDAWLRQLEESASGTLDDEAEGRQEER